MIATGQQASAEDFINDSERDATPANDEGRVPKLEGDAKIARTFLRASFGGTGADGALTVSSGTTNIDLGGLAVVIKNYTSISITGTGKVTFSNAHANGTVIILKSQGNVTLTSSQAPMLDVSGIGASATQNGAVLGSIIPTTNKGEAGGSGTGGAGGAAATLAYSNQTWQTILKYGNREFVGASGGAGSYFAAGGSSATSTGGAGGGGLIIECAGAWNFTTSAGISVAGLSGTSSGSGVDWAAMGAGGGAAGFCFVFYNTLTANSGTITVTGGAGIAKVGPSGSGAHRGGGGGGNYQAGSNYSGDAGGNGANGYSLVALNTEFT